MKGQLGCFLFLLVALLLVGAGAYLGYNEAQADTGFAEEIALNQSQVSVSQAGAIGLQAQAINTLADANAQIVRAQIEAQAERERAREAQERLETIVNAAVTIAMITAVLVSIVSGAGIVAWMVQERAKC